jgi:DNA invertase Pin-like site-specific DNA recombinase
MDVNEKGAVGLERAKKNTFDYDVKAAEDFEKNARQDWSDYWKNHWKGYYSDGHMDNLVKSLEIKIAKLTAEANNFFDENIKLGEIIEYQKQKLNEAARALQGMEQEHRALTQNRGFVKTNLKLMQAKRTNLKLKEENQELRTRHKWVGRSPLDAAVVEKIIALRNGGGSYSEIAAKLNISKAVVSKYLAMPAHAEKLRHSGG